MKKYYLYVALLLSSISFAQDKEAADKLVEEGIAYHDKGDYDGAIVRYDKALKLDKNNLFALAEKAYSLLSLTKYEESIQYCKTAIENYPDKAELKSVYVTYGNALDEMKKTDRALEIYDEGLSKFPDYYQLYFNKGITYSSIRKYDEAALCFQNAIRINPKHASSLNALGRIEKLSNKRIPALLAFSRFFIVEPQTDRAKQNLEAIQGLLSQGVEKTGKKSVNITIDSRVLPDSTDTSKRQNDFSQVDLLLSLVSAADFDKKNTRKTDVENFIRKFETICSSLEELKKDNSGFYWDVIVPYFIEMKNKKLIEPFAYIVFSSSNNEDVSKWIKKNDARLDIFYYWSKEYNWKKNN